MIRPDDELQSDQERGDRFALAYQKLRELIVLGRLAPGSRIIETSVAERLGVSRTPVRAALQRLQQEGYVVVTSPGQQSRMAVAPLTQEDAIELFGVVASIEGLAANWAASNGSGEATLDEIRSLNDALYEVATSSRPDVNTVFEIDRQWHRKVVEAGAGPRLLALHDSFKPQSERYGRIYSSALIDEIAASVEEHRVVIRHIEDGDGDGAEAAMRLNWSNASQRLAAVIESVGERGAW